MFLRTCSCFSFFQEVCSLPLYKCKDLYLKPVLFCNGPTECGEMSNPIDISDDQFGNDNASSPKTPLSYQSKLSSPVNTRWQPRRCQESVSSVDRSTGPSFDVPAINIALEDEKTKELLQICTAWWLSARSLLRGNLVAVPVCGKICFFIVEDAKESSVECSNQDLTYEKRYDLLSNEIQTASSVDRVNVAFLVDSKTRVHLFSSMPLEMGTLNKEGLSLEKDDEAGGISKLGGLSKESAELKEIIINKIQHHAKYTGVLLHGPPGTGKTSLVRCCARDAGVKLFSVNGPEIVCQGYGQSEQALHKVFDDARRDTPSVVFIDELDAIAPARKDGGEYLSQRMVTSLLSLMDEVRIGGLLVIAATNRPDSIDPALRRHGRIDREIEIGVPSRDQRLDILRTLLDEVDHSLMDTEMRSLASTTHGFVGADLAALCNEAALTTLRRYIALKNSYGFSETLDHQFKEPCLKSTDHEDSLALLLSNLALTTDLVNPFGSGEKAPYSRSALQEAIRLDNIKREACVMEEKPLLKVTFDDFEKAKMKVRPSAMREVMVEVPKVSWEDIGGQDEVKKQLIEAVEWPQKHQDAFERIGVRPPTGVLMFGPPGCSKTLMARAVASNAGLNFLAVKGPELFSKWVGESEKAVRSVFAKARSAAPSIIFFDEIDGLAITRGQENDGASVGDRVMSQLLVELDGLNQRVDVTVIAATNRPDKIDSALLRPGRFDRLLYVGPPNEADREDIFRIHLRKMPCSSDVSIRELAHLTEGYTGADISSVCREAALLALEESLDISEISMVHFKVAIKRVQPSEVKSYQEFSAKFQRLVCSDATRDDSIR
ncbi:cam interacting protein 111 isoform X2 [Tasmannia lanceolata]|uniref:cam interacting protein 111 isoform X2 n=1 Tax=Tasmannia lanceolata TaxID=3420 RepID=UPI0040629D34